jgi:hypothetical protein
MFVRFGTVRSRLVVDLVETRREGGKVKSEHIARLGSVALPVEAKERVRFWQELKRRFRDIAARLANRVSSDDRRKALAAIHAAFPSRAKPRIERPALRRTSRSGAKSVTAQPSN